MSHTVTVESGLAAYFKQKAGPSRAGVDWMVRIDGGKGGAVLVRTYFSSDPPREAEKKVLAERAVRLVREKLGEGWRPRGEVLEVEGDGVG